MDHSSGRRTGLAQLSYIRRSADHNSPDGKLTHLRVMLVIDTVWWSQISLLRTNDLAHLENEPELIREFCAIEDLLSSPWRIRHAW
jgi:hypothetical protein